MTHLPVYQSRKEILDALERSSVLVVESPTGSGKTTQIPLILHEAGYAKEGIIGVTQPRRIATLSVSEFIEKQLGAEAGYVGYKMRFSDTTDFNTRIKILTDGMLLMELKADPLLSHYSVILVDEAHERSLNIDFVLGLLKQVLTQRPEFKVIISSATINTKVFSTFFDNAPIISIEARVFDVAIHYRALKHPADPDEIYYTIEHLVVEHVQSKRGGDILVFLPGEYDIKRSMQALADSSLKSKLLVLPLFGRLSKEEQERVFIPTPKGKTKVVVATNIAETSVTIDGITAVIDSGIAKINYYNQKNFTSSLISLPISRSSAEQRSGRSGRTAPGVCYRLYTKEEYHSRPLYGLEEIKRTDLSEVMLRMSELGIYAYEQFPFITKPKENAILSAEQTLQFIKAIDEKRHLTPIGEMMVHFPLLPRHARVLVEAMMRYPSVIQEVIIAISFLSSRTPFHLPPNQEEAARKAHQSFNQELGDFVSYLDIYHQFTALQSTAAKENWCKQKYLDYPSMLEIHHVAQQLSQIVSEMGFPLSSGGSTKEYMMCLCSGLLQNICIKAERNIYRSLTADQIYLHPGSAWFTRLPLYILAGEIVQTSRMYARTVSPLKKEWLDAISPHLSQELLNTIKGKKPAKKERRAKSEKKEERLSDEMALLFKRPYHYANGPKGKKRVIVIPAEDLPFLARANRSSTKKIKNVPATLLYKNHYIHYGDRIRHIFALDGKLDLEKGVFDSPPKGTFSVNKLDQLVDNLQWILALCRLPKRKRVLGFIQLEFSSKGTYRFSVTVNAFEALDNSLYSLSQLMHDADSSPLFSRIRSQFDTLVSLYD
ncbi:MAG: helicase-related protein [Sphaerochaetaceae bacterium]